MKRLRRKAQATLDRLVNSMGEHMARHPRDNKTLDHAAKLGILGDVKAKAGEILIQQAQKVEIAK